MTIAEWHAARRQLRAIRNRLLMAELHHLFPLTEHVVAALEVDRQPLVAGTQLEFIAARLKAFPKLRESVLRLSATLMRYTAVEPEIIRR